MTKSCAERKSIDLCDRVLMLWIAAMSNGGHRADVIFDHSEAKIQATLVVHPCRTGHRSSQSRQRFGLHSRILVRGKVLLI